MKIFSNDMRVEKDAGSVKFLRRCDAERKRIPMSKNSVKKIREALMMSKAELSKKANVSPITLSRIEQGMACRMETKRKILLALGYKLSDKDKIFED